MITSWANITVKFIYTLDQFANDDSSVGLVDNTLTDLLPKAWYLEELVNFVQLNNYVAKVTTQNKVTVLPVKNVGGLAGSLRVDLELYVSWRPTCGLYRHD